MRVGPDGSVTVSEPLVWRARGAGLTRQSLEATPHGWMWPFEHHVTMPCVDVHRTPPPRADSPECGDRRVPDCRSRTPEHRGPPTPSAGRDECFVLSPQKIPLYALGGFVPQGIPAAPLALSDFAAALLCPVQNSRCHLPRELVDLVRVGELPEVVLPQVPDVFQDDVGGCLWV